MRYCLALLLLGLASTAGAAEYTTTRGDTIRSVSRQFGHTTYQFKRMNSLELVDVETELVPGMSLIYISTDDFACARLQIEHLGLTELLASLDVGAVQYRESTGLTYNHVLAFARQWRQDHSGDTSCGT